MSAFASTAPSRPTAAPRASTTSAPVGAGTRFASTAREPPPLGGSGGSLVAPFARARLSLRRDARVPPPPAPPVEGVAEARVDDTLESPEPARRRNRRGPAPRIDREAEDVDADALRIGPADVAAGATRARAAAPPKLAIALAARQPRPPVPCSARGGQRRNAVRRLTAPRVCAARRGTRGGSPRRLSLSDFGTERDLRLDTRKRPRQNRRAPSADQKGGQNQKTENERFSRCALRRRRPLPAPRRRKKNSLSTRRGAREAINERGAASNVSLVSLPSPSRANPRVLRRASRTPRRARPHPPPPAATSSPARHPGLARWTSPARPRDCASRTRPRSDPRPGGSPRFQTPDRAPGGIGMAR